MKTNWLSDFLKWFRGTGGGNEDAGASVMANPESVKQMVRGIISTRPDEIGCDECFEQVGRFADMVLAGMDAEAALPLVQDHLDRCNDCREEFEALLAALRAVS